MNLRNSFLRAEVMKRKGITSVPASALPLDPMAQFENPKKKAAGFSTILGNPGGGTERFGG